MELHLGIPGISLIFALAVLSGHGVLGYLNVSGEVSVSRSHYSEFKTKYIKSNIEHNVDMPKSCRTG